MTSEILSLVASTVSTITSPPSCACAHTPATLTPSPITHHPPHASKAAFSPPRDTPLSAPPPLPPPDNKPHARELMRPPSDGAQTHQQQTRPTLRRRRKTRPRMSQRHPKRTLTRR